ncbi:MAG TPA: hypothetical protein VGR28_08920 [Candidatus Thermoplasmatota archaeon]|nr:hypothetical protein [Candidatus Thermoplasmatota archaeon]
MAAADLALGVLSAALIVLAAKAHGRQVRLERELAGYHDVDFTQDNPPWVEDLWKRDRRRFLEGFGALALVLLAAWFVLAGLPRGLAAWPGALLALAWAFAGAFVVAGLSSLRRWMAALVATTAHGTARDEEERLARPGWLRAAERGHGLWWGLVAVLGALIAALVSLGAAPP